MKTIKELLIIPFSEIKITHILSLIHGSIVWDSAVVDGDRQEVWFVRYSESRKRLADMLDTMKKM